MLLFTGFFFSFYLLDFPHYFINLYSTIYIHDFGGLSTSEGLRVVYAKFSVDSPVPNKVADIG